MEAWTVFRERGLAWGRQPAVTAAREQLTFADLFGQAERLAAVLSRAGIGEGRLVGVALPNSPGLVVAFLALLRLGAVTALLSPKFQTGELRAIVRGVRPAALLADATIAAHWRDVLPGNSAVLEVKAGRDDLVLLSWSPRRRSEDDLPPQPAATSSALHDLALIKFTSGSTGVPKAIALDHRNLLAEADNVTTTLSLGPRDRILVPVPLHHSYGFDLGVLPLLYSGAVLFPQEAFVPRRVPRELAQRAITVYLGVPTMYRLMLQTLPAGAWRLPDLRYLLSCTAPLPPALIRRFAAAFHLPICQHYGSSESGAVTNHLPAEVLRRPDSVGRPLHGVEVEVIGENGTPCAPGEEGEILVRSQAVSRGYLMGQPAGPSPLQGGTFRTGDVGVADEDGFLHVRGRLDDVINVAGLKVYPQEVVQVLEGFPAVAEAAVFAARDSMGEEVVHAAVTLAAPAAEADILSFCRTMLADYKVPRRIEVRSELPRGATGKVRLPREKAQP